MRLHVVLLLRLHKKVQKVGTRYIAFGTPIVKHWLNGQPTKEV